MKKVFVLIILSLFIVVGNVVAADLTGIWEGTMYCSDDGETGEYFQVEIEQEGDFFTSTNIIPTVGEECGGVIDGNNIYMTCPNTIAYGELKGKTWYIINHKPHESEQVGGNWVYWGATCKGTATMVTE